MNKASVTVSVIAAVLVIMGGVGGLIMGRTWQVGASDDAKDDKTTICAEILDISGTSFLVKNLEDGGEYSFGANDDTRITWRGYNIDADDLNAGDKIAVCYLNYILETYPVQIPEVYEIRLVEKIAEDVHRCF